MASKDRGRKWKPIKSAQPPGKKSKRPEGRLRFVRKVPPWPPAAQRRNRLARLRQRRSRRRNRRTRPKRKRKRRGKASFPAHNVSHLADGFGVSQHGQDTGIAPAHFVYAGGNRACAFGSSDHDSRS